MDPRAKLAADMRTCADEIFRSESPFYTELLELMAVDVESGGPCWELLGRFAAEPSTEYFPLRALAGVHLMVLEGRAPELEARYPSVGGDGDARAAWPAVRAALAAHDPEVIGDLRHPLQTNETSRSAALGAGFHLIASRCPLPMRALELGASAGLNLHFDRYRYEAGGLASGPESSPVRFVDCWLGDVPPFDAELEVAERRGCDIDPIDAAGERGRLALLSYVMPDELGRVEMMRGALEVAAADPIAIEAAGADEWIAERLAEPAPGMATVVFHSIFWIYPPREVTDRIATTIPEAGARAEESAPLFWLRYEESAEHMGTIELRLTNWPGGEEELLGTGQHHYARLRWLAA